MLIPDSGTRVHLPAALRVAAYAVTALVYATISFGNTPSARASQEAHFSPQPDSYYALIDPKRPSNSSEIRVTFGVIESFGYSGAPANMLLAVKTDGEFHQYFLSSDSTINGSPMQCGSVALVMNIQFCKSIPALVAGAHVALLWWPAGLLEFANARATDAILLTDGPKSPT